MTQVTIQIGSSNFNQHSYTMTNEKVKYLLKFIHSITEENEKENDLMKEIEIGLKQVKQMRDGKLPVRTLKQMLNGK